MDAFGEVRRAEDPSGAAMGAGVDVDEPRAEPGRAVDVMLQDLDRSLEEVRVATRQVHEVGGVDRDGPDVELAKLLAKRRLLLGRLGPSPPRGRVVAEDLERGRADRVGPLDRLDHPATEGQVGTEPASVGEHPRHPSRPAGPPEPRIGPAVRGTLPAALGRHPLLPR